MRSNIEAAARANLEKRGTFDAASIERCWIVEAALIEAGLVDDDGRMIPHDPDVGLQAVRDWRARR